MYKIIEQFLSGHDATQKNATHFHDTASHKFENVVKKKGISFDESLISYLLRDNEILLENFARILKYGFDRGDFGILCQQLSDFKTQFQNHFVIENVKIFSYLEQAIEDDSEALVKLRSTRKEINNLSNYVIAFCKKYSCPLGALNLRDSFKGEYQSVGITLIHRMQVVETEIYPSYNK